MVKEKEVKFLQHSDVESFMGMAEEDYVSRNAEKHNDPLFKRFDALIIAVSTAAIYEEEPEQLLLYQQESKEEFFQRLEYKAIKNKNNKTEYYPLITEESTTPPQQLLPKTKRLLQYHKVNNKRVVKRPLHLDYQEEENHNRPKKKKKTKRTNATVVAGGGRSKRRVSEPAALSPEVEKLMAADKEPVMVIRKELEKSDVDRHQNRMSVPSMHMERSFLTNTEEVKLRRKDYLEVPIIMPSLKRGVIKLRRWKMKKTTGTASVSYMLAGDWSKLMMHEGLKAKMEVQLWAYRVDGELRFALLNLSNPNPNPNPKGDGGSL